MFNKIKDMGLKSIFSGMAAIDKAVGVIDSIVPDGDRRYELKYEIYKIIASSMVAKWVRAILSFMFFIVWLFFPEKLAGREDLSKYMLYAIAAYYFLVDRGLSGIKKK